MLRISTLTWLFLSVLTGYLLFNISQKTEDERHKIANLERKISQETESLTVLKAEWSALNRPSRLVELSEKHLDLHRITHIPKLTEQHIPNTPAEQEDTTKDNSRTTITKPSVVSVPTKTALHDVHTPHKKPVLKPRLNKPQVPAIFVNERTNKENRVQRAQSSTTTHDTRNFNDVLKGLN